MKKYIQSTTTDFRPERIPWDQYIPGDVLDRLSDCCTRKADLKILRDAIWQYIQDNNAQDDWTIEDAAVLVLEWVGDWNNQYTLTDSLTADQYDRFLQGK